jgi:EAL domain-containing protein (putative c-di-GMP-specific phosphodiesterase class I)/PAS domain-containing protein
MGFLFKLTLFLSQRGVKTVLTLLLTLVLGVMVIATIYFTLFDLQWLAFLGGILFAAVLSMASQASKAEWLIIRRTRQVERLREQVQKESARRKISEDAMLATEARMRMVNDLLPLPILFVDRDLRIHDHNKATLEITRIPEIRIEGQLLRDVMSSSYMEMLPHCRETLTGTRVEYQLKWHNGEKYTVKQVPHPPGTDRPIGFYIVMLPTHSAPGTTAQPADSYNSSNNHTAINSDPHAAITRDSGETMYLHSISDQLMAGDDPRSKLVRALKKNEFLLFAQKVLPLKTLPFDHGSYEILLRLREEEDNLLPPGGFIPMAERYGMTEDIDRWVVHNVITWSMTRKIENPQWDIPMFSINLSEASIINPEFARFVRQELKHSEFPASQLCFEIGELETISNHDNVANFIAALKPAGCRFTVDDFGSVKLSFSNLSGLRLDFVKIDGVIIQNMFKTPADMAKLKAIINVCGKLGLKTVAEFVEDERTLAMLREIGVDYAQGFGIDRPGPVIKAFNPPH